MIDALVHLHYSFPVPNRTILSSFEQTFLPFMHKYGIDIAQAAFVPENFEAMEHIVGAHKNILPGLYITIESYDDATLIGKSSPYTTLKINAQLFQPLFYQDMMTTLLDKALEQGFTRFQIHTDKVADEDLDMLSEYRGKAKFHLVHGVHATFDRNHINLEKLRSLKNTVFLGTSNFEVIYFLDDDILIKAIGLGLDDMLVFETDFMFGESTDPLSFYGEKIDVVKRAIGNNPILAQKIFHDNMARFLDLAQV